MTYMRKNGRFSFIAMPLFCALIVMGVFGLARLRSSFVTLEYQIGALERQKLEALKEKKVIAAELASMRSVKEFEHRGIALEFPDRQKVVYVHRDGGGLPFVAALEKR